MNIIFNNLYMILTKIKNIYPNKYFLFFLSHFIVFIFFSINVNANNMLANKSGIKIIDELNPLIAYFKQIRYKLIDDSFIPKKSGFDNTYASCSLSTLGGDLTPKKDYNVVYYNSEPLFLELRPKFVIPLKWFNIPFTSKGIDMKIIEETILETIALISQYYRYGYNLNAWNNEIQYAYDFAPRWLSPLNCKKLGLMSLLTFQGVYSPLEDLGEDVRYEKRPDNTVLEGISFLTKNIEIGKKLLIYKPGAGAEAIKMALQGVKVTALCTNEIEKMNLTCNAMLNGIDSKYLKIVSRLDKEDIFDYAYCNAPRPIFPDLSKDSRGFQFMFYDYGNIKFDKEGIVTKNYLDILSKHLIKTGTVFCIGPNIPVYHELINENGYIIRDIVQKIMIGDMFLYELKPNSNLFNNNISLYDLFLNSINSSISESVREIYLKRINKIFSDLSETGIDADISANAYNYFGSLNAFLPDKLLSFVFLQLLLETKKFKDKQNFKSFEDIINSIDTGLIQMEDKLSKITEFKDPFTFEGLELLTKKAFDISDKNIKGMFLKRDKIKWMLKINPPINLMREYNKESIDDLLKDMDEVDIFSIARFLEDNEWTEKNFKLYNSLTFNDFEERSIKILILKELPKKLEKTFQKKLPFTNDKIAGTLIGYPMPFDDKQNKVPILRTLSRALHYIHEIKFYSETFKARILDKVEDNRALGESIGDVLGDNISINQFFEPHALVEVLFMAEAMENIEKHLSDIFPEYLKDYPFTLLLYENGNFLTTSWIDRITTLSKGYESELHAKRYLRLAPLIHYFKDVKTVSYLLSRTYLFPEFITNAMKFRFSPYSLQRMDFNELFSGYDIMVKKYLNKTIIPKIKEIHKSA